MTWPLGVQLGWEDCIVRVESVLQEAGWERNWVTIQFCIVTWERLWAGEKAVSRYNYCIVTEAEG